MNKITLLLLLTMPMGGVARGQSNPCTPPNNHCVVLTWKPSPTYGILGYYIFRGEKPGEGDKKQLNSSPVARGCGIIEVTILPHHKRERHIGPPCTWTDNTVQPGVPYYYYVTAVDADGKTQSKSSNEASAKVQGKGP